MRSVRFTLDPTTVGMGVSRILAVAHDWLLGELMDRRVFMTGRLGPDPARMDRGDTEPARLAAVLNGGWVDTNLIKYSQLAGLPPLQQMYIRLISAASSACGRFRRSRTPRRSSRRHRGSR